jgi:hypothetical protein
MANRLSRTPRDCYAKENRDHEGFKVRLTNEENFDPLQRDRSKRDRNAQENAWEQSLHIINRTNSHVRLARFSLARDRRPHFAYPLVGASSGYAAMAPPTSTATFVHSKSPAHRVRG